MHLLREREALLKHAVRFNRLKMLCNLRQGRKCRRGVRLMVYLLQRTQTNQRRQVSGVLPFFM